MKGIIALDIDGTSTAEYHRLSKPVLAYFEDLVRAGWQLIFITGRPFAWGVKPLRELNCPYFLAVQNGALIFEMPAEKIIQRRYIDTAIFPLAESACADEPTDYVIYGGYEQQDVCYFRPQRFSKPLLDYLRYRIAELEEHWIEVHDYDNLPLSYFPSIKCFGEHASLSRIQQKLDGQHLHMPIINDPLGDARAFVAQGTDPLATKGDALRSFSARFDKAPLIIAAGDDFNDISMLEAATIKVVMATAPQELLAIADIVAPSAALDGIIEGLNKAIMLKH